MPTYVNRFTFNQSSVPTGWRSGGSPSPSVVSGALRLNLPAAFPPTNRYVYDTGLCGLRMRVYQTLSQAAVNWSFMVGTDDTTGDYFLLRANSNGSVSAAQLAYADGLGTTVSATAGGTGSTPNLTGVTTLCTEIVVTAGYPRTVTINRYDATSGDVGAGATLISTANVSGGGAKLLGWWNVQGPIKAGFSSDVSSAGNTDFARIEIEEDTDLYAAVPVCVQNDAGGLTIQPYFGGKPGATITYSLYGVDGSTSSFTPGSGNLLVSGATGPISLPAVATDSTRSLILRTTDGTTTADAAFVVAYGPYSNARTLVVANAAAHSWGAGTGAVGGNDFTTVFCSSLAAGYDGDAARTVVKMTYEAVAGATSADWAPGHAFLEPALSRMRLRQASVNLSILDTNDNARSVAQVVNWKKQTLQSIAGISTMRHSIHLTAPPCIDTGNGPSVARARLLHAATLAALTEMLNTTVQEVIDVWAMNSGPSGQTDPTPPAYTAGVDGSTWPGTWMNSTNFHPNGVGHPVLGRFFAGWLLSSERKRALVTTPQLVAL